MFQMRFTLFHSVIIWPNLKYGANTKRSKDCGSELSSDSLTLMLLYKCLLNRRFLVILH